MITAANADQLQSESADPEYSFADEMVSTALVDLGKSRISSAIVHAVIALESASKQAFERCVREKLPGFEKGGTVEAVSKELSVVAFSVSVRLSPSGLVGSEAPLLALGPVSGRQPERRAGSRNSAVRGNRDRSQSPSSRNESRNRRPSLV
jgi:hypothetical protein